MRASAAALRNIIRCAKRVRPAQAAEHEPVCTQLLQKADFLDLGFEARRPLARRHGAEPFETADPAILNWRQQARQPRFSVGPGNRGDGFEQGLLLVPPRGADETSDFALAQNEIIVIDEP